MQLDFSFNSIAQILILSRIAKPEEIKSCTQEEIERIELKLKIRLPKIYKDFLLICGHRAGIFFRGTDMFYNDLLNIQGWAKELFRENKVSFTLSSDVFVFSMHQGYQFMYFHTKLHDDDPPVYYYIEGQKEPKKINEHFSRFILESLRQHIDFLKKS